MCEAGDQQRPLFRERPAAFKDFVSRPRQPRCDIIDIVSELGGTASRNEGLDNVILNGARRGRVEPGKLRLHLQLVKAKVTPLGSVALRKR